MAQGLAVWSVRIWAVDFGWASFKASGMVAGCREFGIS